MENSSIRKLTGRLPKVGIRPTIDGRRRGVRESLEEQTMTMAKNAAQKDAEWDFVIKMTLISRDLMVGNQKLKELGFGEEALGHNTIVSGFQGQRQCTDNFPNGNFMEAMLCSSFDWNGIRQPFLVATENDSLNGVSMLFGHLITGSAQVFSDVRTYWSPEAVERVTGYKPEGLASNGFIHLINSGSSALDGTGQQTIEGKPGIKSWWDIFEEEVKACFDNTGWAPAIQEYFRGGGFSSNFITKGGMPITLSRLNLVKGLGPVLQIADGYTAELPEEVHKTLDLRTNPSWPSTWFVPNITGKGAFTHVYSVMANWGANHGAFSYRHIGADLITLASMLCIPVNMHNVADEKIFRPTTWSPFGMDKEAADYPACANFGTLYK
jgi:L-fucose isomerase